MRHAGMARIDALRSVWIDDDTDHAAWCVFLIDRPVRRRADVGGDQAPGSRRALTQHPGRQCYIV